MYHHGARTGYKSTSCFSGSIMRQSHVQRYELKTPNYPIGYFEHSMYMSNIYIYIDPPTPPQSNQIQVVSGYTFTHVLPLPIAFTLPTDCPTDSHLSPATSPLRASCPARRRSAARPPHSASWRNSPPRSFVPWIG